MASGGWSNIFLQMIAGMPPLPVIGEAWLEGWWTQIELEKFSWGLAVKTNPKRDETGLGSAIGGAVAAAGGAVAGNVAGLGGEAGIAAAATAAAIAAAALAKGDKPEMEPGVLKMWKRFDIASSRIHTVIDNDMPVISALITVVHVKADGITSHQPGFTLLATDGYLEKVDVSMERGDKGVEVVEEFDMHYKSIIITYSKKLGANNVPMAPFIYIAASEAKK